jgi:hypothetical protein
MSCAQDDNLESFDILQISSPGGLLDGVLSIIVQVL